MGLSENQFLCGSYGTLLTMLNNSCLLISRTSLFSAPRLRYLLYFCKYQSLEILRYSKDICRNWYYQGKLIKVFTLVLKGLELCGKNVPIDLPGRIYKFPFCRFTTDRIIRICICNSGSKFRGSRFKVRPMKIERFGLDEVIDIIKGRENFWLVIVL